MQGLLHPWLFPYTITTVRFRIENYKLAETGSEKPLTANFLTLQSMAQDIDGLRLLLAGQFQQHFIESADKCCRIGQLTAFTQQRLFK